MLGPVESIIVEFKGNRFRGEIVPELRQAVERGIIRIMDLTFVKKDQAGNVQAFELYQLDDEEAAAFQPLGEEIDGLFSEEDISAVATALENDSSAALLLFEHAWAAGLRQAIANANGRLIADERIPSHVLDEALSALARTAG
jgi:hypothetical protein